MIDLSCQTACYVLNVHFESSKVQKTNFTISTATTCLCRQDKSCGERKSVSLVKLIFLD